MFPDIVGKGIRVEKHIDALIGGDIRRDILEQQIGEVVEGVLNVVVLQIERAPLRVRHVTVAEGLPQIGEDDLLLVAEMLPQVAFELGVEVGDEGAVLAVHRFEQRVEMVLDVGQLVVKVVAMRKQQILQDVGHGTLPQLVNGGIVGVLGIDSGDEQEQRERHAVLVAELLDTPLAEAERDAEARKHGQQTVVLVDGVGHLHLG